MHERVEPGVTQEKLEQSCLAAVGRCDLERASASCGLGLSTSG
jgi:hypothetical protein